jgi:hypothetical protein
MGDDAVGNTPAFHARPDVTNAGAESGVTAPVESDVPDVTVASA